MIMEPGYIPEDTMQTNNELPALDPEVDPLTNIAGFVPNITETFPDIADSASNAANSVPNIADSASIVANLLPNIADFLPNITNYFPDVVGSFPNITEYFPNIDGSLPNITDVFPNITDFFRNTIDDNLDTAFARPVVGAVDTGLVDKMIEKPITESIMTAITTGMTTAKPDVTKVVQNIFSTVSTLNSSVSPIPKFNSTTIVPTKEPIKKMTTLLANVSTTTSYYGTAPSTNTTTSESICGSGYTVDECDWVVNFESILSPILMILIIIGLVANVYIVYTIIVRKDMRTFSNLFMTNLSVTHLIYLVVIGATDVYDYVLTTRDIVHSSIIPSSIHLYISLVSINLHSEIFRSIHFHFIKCIMRIP